MATKKKDEKETTSKTYHEAIRPARIGSKKDGSAKNIINKGDRLTLDEKQVESYRFQKIIE